jgi:hypothetical protein
VLWFTDAAEGLVINKSRAEMMRKITGSPLLGAWANAGTVAIKPGIANGHAQIVITAVRTAEKEPAGNGRVVVADYDLDQANDDLIAH